MLVNLWQDVRYAARRLARGPSFTAAAVVTIALGVGINTGIFTVLNGVLFRNLPASDAHELVSIYQTVEGVPDRGANLLGLFSTAEYETYRDRTQTLSVLSHSDPWEAALGGDAPQEVRGVLVSCNYFDVLQQQPAFGRGLTANDCAAGAEPVVVLSHELWTTSFDADATIVGRAVELSRRLFTVVGVAPEGTYGGFVYKAAFFAPISAQPILRPDQRLYDNDQASWLALVGRRHDGASLDQVRAELGVIAAQIDQQEPNRSTTLTVERATPLSIPLIRGVALGAGAVIMTAFGLILLIACANVANLLLARATATSREIAMRLSLGASRARIIQQLLTESALISLIGGALGSVLALWSFQLLVAFVLSSFLPVGAPPVALDPSPDIRVLTLALALTFGTGILFGLAPAMHVSKPDLHTVIKQDSFGTGSSRRGGRLRGTLVGVQVALCTALMIGAGLLVRGLHATQTVDPGFDYRDVVYASYNLENAGYDPEEAAVFRQRMMEEVSALSSVEAVAYAAQEPLGDDIVFGDVRLPSQDERAWRRAELNWVTPNYFSLIGLPIVRGRTFRDAELADAANDSRAAIVTETTARNYWPGQDPIGQTLLWRWPGVQDQDVALQIVGVAKDAQVSSVGRVDPYFVYLPARQSEVLLVKGRTDFGSTAAGIRAAAQALDPGVVVRVNALEENLVLWRKLSGMVTALAGSLGILALVLASVGVYGVVSYFVASRVREIGIRMALGAKARNVLGLILRQTMRPVVIGVLIGVAAAVAMSGILSSVLFGVSPLDPIGLGGAVLFVLGVVLAAIVLPARRAVRADPMAALHYE